MADAPVSFLPLGAIIQSINVGGINIVQGFPEQEQYQKYNGPYFGETIGRIANRTKGAKIDSLNGGKTYTLAANDGPNNLHGGNEGWGKKIWDGPTPIGIRAVPGIGDLDGGESVKFSLVSPDGDEGFPGTVETSVVYTVGTQKQDGKEVLVLAYEYEAELVEGADETVINMTNHSYFNLAAKPTIEGTVAQLATDKYLPIDDRGIPVDDAKAFRLKVTEAFTLGPEEPDIDDCFVVTDAASAVSIDTRSEPLTKLVSAHHPESKVHLEVYSTEPAFQFYTGKFIDVPEIPGVPARGKRSGFCVEPSRYVNAANVDEWKGQVLLKKGEKYGSRTVYKAWRE